MVMDDACIPLEHKMQEYELRIIRREFFGEQCIRGNMIFRRSKVTPPFGQLRESERLLRAYMLEKGHAWIGHIATHDLWDDDDDDQVMMSLVLDGIKRTSVSSAKQLSHLVPQSTCRRSPRAVANSLCRQVFLSRQYVII